MEKIIIENYSSCIGTLHLNELCKDLDYKGDGFITIHFWDLRHKFAGYGHREVSLEFEIEKKGYPTVSRVISTTVNDLSGTDDTMDDDSETERKGWEKVLEQVFNPDKINLAILDLIQIENESGI